MMTLSSNCSMNVQPSPSTLASSSSPPRPKSISQVALPKAERVSHTNKSWTNKFVLGVACMIISLDTGKFVDDHAIAGEIKAIVQSNDQRMQWSSKRKCAPWRFNSLETIVPENLPRPSARRRWENVDYAKVNAPAVQDFANLRSNCFSM